MTTYQAGDLVRWNPQTSVEEDSTIGIVLDVCSMPFRETVCTVLWADDPVPRRHMVRNLIPVQSEVERGIT